jgi:hypothetical protein
LAKAKLISNREYLKTILDIREKDLIELAKISEKVKRLSADDDGRLLYDWVFNSIILDISKISDILSWYFEADARDYLNENVTERYIQNVRILYDIYDINPSYMEWLFFC